MFLSGCECVAYLYCTLEFLCVIAKSGPCFSQVCVGGWGSNQHALHQNPPLPIAKRLLLCDLDLCWLWYCSTTIHFKVSHTVIENVMINRNHIQLPHPKSNSLVVPFMSLKTEIRISICLRSAMSSVSFTAEHVSFYNAVSSWLCPEWWFWFSAVD